MCIIYDATASTATKRFDPSALETDCLDAKGPILSDYVYYYQRACSTMSNML